MASLENIRLETDRLVLRPFIREDKEEFYRIVQDPEIYKTLPEDHMYDRDEISEIIDWFVETYRRNAPGNIIKLPLALCLKPDLRMIGDMGIGKLSYDESETEVFYFINSAYWGRGYVSEAMGAFMPFIKERIRIARFVAYVVDGNRASSRILEKNGFVVAEKTLVPGSTMYELPLRPGA